MDKGFFTSKTQDWAIALLKVKLQEAGVKPVPIMLILLAVKAGFMYGDDVVAENNVPQQVTDGIQKICDFLIDGKVDEAFTIAIELVPFVMEWLKPKPVVPALGEAKKVIPIK